MAKVKVMIRNNQREVKIPVGLRLLVRKCCQAVLTTEKFPGAAEVSVSFVDNAEIRKLNRVYRNKDKSTDVLSFPLGENGVYDLNNETGAYLLGDVVISMETAVKQAHIYGHSLEREVGFLTVHSMLHASWQHQAVMFHGRSQEDEKEEIILDSLGISRDATFVNDGE